MTAPPAAAACVAVTGATGFIGRNLCDHFRRRGWEVRALARSRGGYPFSEPGIGMFACDLPDTLDDAALRGARAVIHCAYVTRHRDLAGAARVNDAGTRRVIEASRAAGVPRFVFISSQSAHDEARSYYGRSKRAIERLLSGDRDLVIRPGLVLGAGAAGLFGRMCATVRESRVIPLFGGGRQPLQTVHIDDLCEAIAAAVDRGLTGRYTVAETTPVSMGDFLRALAARLGRRPIFVPFPVAPAIAVLRSLEALRVPFPVSSENLLGLRYMRADDTAGDLRAIGVQARSAWRSLDDIFSEGPSRVVA